MSEVENGEREVIVVTGRADLELAITLWLPGFRARTVPHLARAAAAGPKTVVLVERETLEEAGGTAAIRELGVSAPLIVLGSDEVLIDLTDDTVVHSPFGLEEVQVALNLVVGNREEAADQVERGRRSGSRGGRRRRGRASRITTSGA